MNALRNIARATFASLALSIGVIGCASDNKDIPSDAHMVTSGRAVTWTAPQSGTAYVYDHGSNRLLWSGRLMRDQMINVDTDKNQISANGTVVSSHTLNPGATNDVYFAPSPMSDQAQQSQSSQTGNNNNANLQPNPNSVILTPGVSVGQSNGDGTVTVSPELRVKRPATQPSQQ
ncbi:MAG TPA: hypothetical protein VFC78_04950 [Tepidisphaeraceae bacterium]|nr:hypothetical protein [Tepidisphaeraceae bacterium]